MNTIYPSKNFLTDAKNALNAHDIFEISVQGGWRGRVLAKEVGTWIPVAEASEIGGGLWKAPSITCSLLMMPLLTMHYAALSAQYEMQSEVDGSTVVLTYLPL